MGELGNTLGRLSASNLIDASRKQAELLSIQERVAEIDLRRDFKNDPIKTLDNIKKGVYSRHLTPERLEQIKDHLAASYRVAQADLKRQISEYQDNNFADAMIQARKGTLTQGQIEEMSSVGSDGLRRIDAQQAVHLTNQIRATAASGGVMYSDPATLSDLQFRLHKGVVGADEVRNKQLNGLLTIGDANELYTGIESRMRRDRAEAREIRAESRLNDIANDPNYRRAEQFITKALPNADRLDLDHSYRIMVGQALVDFDQTVRMKDEKGQPKYKPSELQGIAEKIVDGTLLKMDLIQNSARAKLLPGIKTPEDVAEGVRSKRLTPVQAKEQMRYLLQLGIQIAPTTTSAQSSITQGRDAIAKERAKAQGAQ
jgi:hypothetical protein